VTASCNCSARWTAGTCQCSWRDHLTKPLTITVPWLYDDGTTTSDATLTGLVYPNGDVEIQSLTIDATGDEVEVPRKQRREAEGDLSDAAYGMWRKEAS
jgi:hypothetical protein